MRISWREVLGLLVGLAICYGVMSYALTYGLQNRETASEGTETRLDRTTSEQRTTPAPPTTTPSPPSSPSGTRTLTVRVTGFNGEPFSGVLGTSDSTQPVTGTVLTDFELQVRTGPPTDSVFATIRKTAGNNNALTVQVVDGSTVLTGESTSAPYGTVSVAWSLDEQQTAGAKASGQ